MPRVLLMPAPALRRRAVLTAAARLPRARPVLPPVAAPQVGAVVAVLLAAAADAGVN
jgi:hypothetical protein